jgi:hypothetical protein
VVPVKAEEAAGKVFSGVYYALGLAGPEVGVRLDKVLIASAKAYACGEGAQGSGEWTRAGELLDLRGVLVLLTREWTGMMSKYMMSPGCVHLRMEMSRTGMGCLIGSIFDI